MRSVILVVKNVKQTKIMQSFDLFEDFKFVGFFLDGEQEDSHAHLTAKDILEHAKKNNNDDENHETVGVIIPEVGSCFVPNHRVFSNGKQWMTVEDMCKGYHAPLVELKREVESKCDK